MDLDRKEAFTSKRAKETHGKSPPRSPPGAQRWALPENSLLLPTQWRGSFSTALSTNSPSAPPTASSRERSPHVDGEGSALAATVPNPLPSHRALGAL